MTIQAAVNMAISGELKNLAVKTDISAITDYFNLGILELYKRFPLSVKEQIIEVVAAEDSTTDIYDLNSDCMWIVAAYGEVGEDTYSAVKTLPINEEDNPASINTISWSQVQIPTASITNTYVSLIYVAEPPMLTYDSDTETFTYYDSEGQLQTMVNLPIPSQLVEALLHYIGYRAHGSVNGEINAENTTHYTRFEASCNRAIQLGMFTGDDTNTRNRIYDKGFA